MGTKRKPLSKKSRKLLNQGLADIKAGRVSPVPPEVTEPRLTEKRVRELIAEELAKQVTWTFIPASPPVDPCPPQNPSCGRGLRLRFSRRNRALHGADLRAAAGMDIGNDQVRASSERQVTMHHKRKRPKHLRSDCLHCKTWKDEREAKANRIKPNLRRKLQREDDT